MATPPQVGRPRTVSSSTKKRRRKNWSKTQISLVDSFEDWKALKEAGGWTHNQLARHLMDIHAAHCSHEKCSANWASSCLGASGGVQLAPEESRSRSRPSSPFAMDLEFGTSSSSHSTEQSTVREVEEPTNQFVSTPIDPMRDVNMSFPSDISCVDSDSEDSDDSLAEAFRPLDESGESCLDQSYIDEEVFCFTHAEEEDTPAVDEGLTGRLTGDCTPEQAVMQDKCVAFVSLLEDLVMRVVGKLCPVEGCHGERTFQTTKRGSCAVITWKCENCKKKAASGSWSSQPRVGGMYAGNLILPASVLLSGNNLLKVILMWKFANVWFPAASQFYSLQRLYFHPVIEDAWEESRRELMKGVANGVILAGDGRMDSPGHSAQYCTYSLMDHDRKCVLSMQCIDVRQAKHSNDMERVGLLKAIDDLRRLGVKIGEVVTDGHIQIKHMMRTNEMLSSIIHQVDIWHASKNLMKRLSAAGKKKECGIILLWMAAVRNHFWYSCQTCGGDETKLKDNWIKVANHVVNKHTWLDLEGFTDGGCNHGDLPSENETKPWIEVNSPAHFELLDVIFDKRFVKAVPYYRNFRHTSYLESFHNHILMYASKRHSFSYVGYVTRNRLAAIDFNYHRNRVNMKDGDGNDKFKAKYSKATKQWHPVPVKEPKTYGYIPQLLENIVKARVVNPCSFNQAGRTLPDDPKNIRPRMSTVPKPTTEELKEQYKSRFTDNQWL